MKKIRKKSVFFIFPWKKIASSPLGHTKVKVNYKMPVNPCCGDIPMIFFFSFDIAVDFTVANTGDREKKTIIMIKQKRKKETLSDSLFNSHSNAFGFA